MSSTRADSQADPLSMDTLPPELILYIIPFFPLKSLIAARGVDTRWCYFAQTASLHPARKPLLDVYLAAIVHPNFLCLRDALYPHVHEFDREAYIRNLTSRGCVLPDIFELWVLEWPSKAVHFWAWPGLPEEVDISHEIYYHGDNGLNETSPPTPVICTIKVPKQEANRPRETCEALMLWETRRWGIRGVVHLWLVVDANGTPNDRRAGWLLWTNVEDWDELPRTPEQSLCGFCSNTERIVRRSSCVVCAATRQPLRVIWDGPINASSELVAFIDLLDMTQHGLDWVLERYYLGGVPYMDE